jgi:hypothetical protein
MALWAVAVPFGMEPFDSPVCAGCVIRDRDGNEIRLHACE